MIYSFSWFVLLELILKKGVLVMGHFCLFALYGKARMGYFPLL